ncbi:MAG: M20/M25/M40 family metallo-hydrolase [Desulfuromonadales bacterium]|nr:M20/M25/M40 family metallo-hydrolase [Desulfuromonadales bacterium]NIR32961.1 M20/M25/M40 family metallo-hydrolase [Desulfuromonadales bacterium]NIS40519.1 M20/M25/M40 family metallo-hydrolase [Desulfuromonadales bacterium]
MINADRIADEFARMAAISSPSFREGAMAQYLEQRLRRLGAQVEMDDAAERCEGECGNLIARLPGTRDGEPFLLSVHLDTVEPAAGVTPVLKDGVFTSEGDTILGADDKAGIAEVIEALEVLREQNIPHVAVEIVATIGEEHGLVGAKLFDPARLRARRGMALDTTGVDLVIHRAPAANRMRFEIEGVEAHAGIAPEKGLSAIEVAARAVARMQLGRIDEETTANIGRITGGQACNIVPKAVAMEGEARSHDPAKLASQTRHMLECVEEAANELQREIGGERVRARIRSEVDEDYPVMSVPLDAPILELVREAAAVLDRPVLVRSAGGGSDANVFNGYGIETVIVGTGMTDVHSVDESVRLDDMVRVSEFLVEVLRRA